MIIGTSHRLYSAALKPVVFASAAHRARYNGSDLDKLRDGGYDWYIYAPPTPDPYTQKLDGLKVIDGITVTEGVVVLTQPEISAKLGILEIQLTRGIDEAAGAKRAVLLSPGSFVDQEYIFAYTDALAYQAAEYVGPVPAGVQSWADAKIADEWTAEDAARDILDTRAEWYAAGMTLRTIRLAGKEAVRNAATAAGKQAAHNATISQFDALPF